MLEAAAVLVGKRLEPAARRPARAAPQGPGVPAGRPAARGGAPGTGGTGGTTSGTGGAPGTGGTGGTTGQSGVYPVVPAANGRYLQDQGGNPFPILGRAVWFATSRVPADYLALLDDTVARGYNSIELQVPPHPTIGNHPPFDGNGNAPFLRRLDGATWNGSLTYGGNTGTMPDFTTPNEAYWSFIDTFLAACNTRGLLVFFFPAYVGFVPSDQGWLPEMVANGTAKIQAYGAFIANRYRNQRNLVWMIGGDSGTGNHVFTQAESDVENALITGIKSVAGVQATQWSAEWESDSIATDVTRFASTITLNGVYSWTGAIATHSRRAYMRTPVIPAFLLEEPYDQEGPDGNGYNPNATQPVRRFQWWGWLSTIGGYIAGNGYVWPFRDGWQTHLDTQGSRDMARLNAFIKSITWWQLVPVGAGRDEDAGDGGGGSASRLRLRRLGRHPDRDPAGGLRPAGPHRRHHRRHDRARRHGAGALAQPDHRRLHDHRQLPEHRHPGLHAARRERLRVQRLGPCD